MARRKRRRRYQSVVDLPERYRKQAHAQLGNASAPVHKYKTEEAFRVHLVTEATTRGWRSYHTRYSRGSDPGFPDQVFIRPPRIVFAELKIPPRKMTPNQVAWFTDLKRTPGVEAYLWTPADWKRIMEVLA